MAAVDFDIDQERANRRLLRFLAVEGITGQERAIGEAVIDELTRAGVPRRAIRFDSAAERIPVPTQTGNLIVTLPGTRPGPRRLMMTHLDTVPLCAGAKPVRKGNRIVAAGPTALGGDNRTGVAVLATLAAALIEHELPHPPLTLLFTVREESGLWGARFVDLGLLGNPVEAFNVDGRSAAELTIAAVGAERWEAEIHGLAAHAGVYPDRGVSATVVASLALARVFEQGWFGKVRRHGREGTSNVGSFGGAGGKSAGEATNVVTDYVLIKGEARSHDARFSAAILRAYKEAFRDATRRVTSAQGRTARVRFRTRKAYYPFRLKPSSPAVRRALRAAAAAGLPAQLTIGNGGLDANWLVRHGVPTVTFGAGQHNIHSVGEYVDLAEFAAGCRLALTLATAESGASA